MNKGVDFTLILPPEIIVEIIVHVPFRDLGSIRATCRLLSMIPFEGRYTQRNPAEVRYLVKYFTWQGSRKLEPLKKWLLPCLMYSKISDFSIINVANCILHNNDIDTIQWLLTRDDVPAYLFERCFHVAVWRGYTSITRLLLSKVTPDLFNVRSAIDGGHIDIIRLLLPVNPIYNYHLIEYAKRQGKLEIVHLLQTFSGSPGSTNPAAPSCPPPL